jgi:hypothetical protein
MEVATTRYRIRSPGRNGEVRCEGSLEECVAWFHALLEGAETAPVHRDRVAARTEAAALILEHLDAECGRWHLATPSTR